MGLDWRVHDGLAAVAEWEGRWPQEGSIGFAMHLDVVPAEENWTHPPFAAHVHDGTIWGRGTQDDKGPAAAVLAAVDVVQQLGLVPDKDVRLLFGTLEETEDWPDMDHLLEVESPPDVTLVPDGAFPVVVGEKGILTVQWRGDWDEAPRDGLRFIGLHSGRRANLVPGSAVLQLACIDADAARERLRSMPGTVREPHTLPPAAEDEDVLEIVFEGREAHGAFPDEGQNAAHAALEALCSLFSGTGVGSYAQFLLAHTADLDGTALGLTETHDRMGESSVNLGVLRMGPSYGFANVNVRFPFGLDAEAVLRRCMHAADGVADDVAIETRSKGRPQDPVFVSPEDHPHLIGTLQAVYQATTGREGQLACIAGTTYVKALPMAVGFGPHDALADEPLLVHQPDERVTVERYLENVRIYALAIIMLACQGQTSEA